MTGRLLRLAVTVLAATACSGFWASPALAIGGGAGATGSGDEIITSILAANDRSEGSGGGHADGAAPRCRTHVLGDRQIVFLLHVAANMPELLAPSFLDALAEFSNTTVVAAVPPSAGTSTVPADPDPPPTATSRTTTSPTTTSPTTSSTVPVATEPMVTYWELTVRICGGVADTMSVRPRSVSGSVLGASAVAGGLLRRTTRLAPPVLRISPPPRSTSAGVAAETIVGEPVFFSAEPPTAVSDTVSFAGRTVQVEAEPHHLELFSGQPGSADQVERCAGLGRPFDATDDRSVSLQAADPVSCVLFFEHSTGAPRRPTWTGYAALNWSGRYRVDGGAWLPLDGLFSTAVFDIAVGEVETLIQNG